MLALVLSAEPLRPSSFHRSRARPVTATQTMPRPQWSLTITTLPSVPLSLSIPLPTSSQWGAALDESTYGPFRAGVRVEFWVLGGS